MITDPRADIVVVGGGHNALVAAAYLARAGRRVQVLEIASQGPDHPVPPAFPEGRYLKFVL